MKRYHKLNDDERLIVIDKGTEVPGKGAYYQNDRVGVYICCQCDAPLYLSSHKFHSGCGWPSFDDALAGAVLQLPDSDGHRLEIQCHRCHGHLGHLFKGEGFTSKHVRHCVNSLSMRFLPAFTEEGYERAYLAAGCFWGLQYALKRLNGVVFTQVGYTGGGVNNPSYQEVCSSQTGHVEAVEVHWDPVQLTYGQLLKSFFGLHDPFDGSGQGPDRGPQYQPVIFYMTNSQYEIAHAFKDGLERESDREVATELRPATVFYPAESFHQNYHES